MRHGLLAGAAAIAGIQVNRAFVVIVRVVLQLRSAVLKVQVGVESIV